MDRSSSNAAPFGGRGRASAVVALALVLILAFAISSSSEGDTGVVLDPDNGSVVITHTQHIGIGPSAQSYVETTTVITAPLDEEK